METRVIFFDFVGVLLFLREDRKPDDTTIEIEEIIRKTQDDKLSKNEIMKNYHMDEKGFDAILDAIIDRYEPFSPLWQMLPDLKGRYKLGVINNGTALTLPGFRKRYLIDQIFDTFISSAVEGVRKPDRRIFELAAERIGARPEECLFMDDSLSSIRGAKEFGMRTIHWKDRESGLAQFKNFLETDNQKS